MVIERGEIFTYFRRENQKISHDWLASGDKEEGGVGLLICSEGLPDWEQEDWLSQGHAAPAASLQGGVAGTLAH